MIIETIQQILPICALIFISAAVLYLLESTKDDFAENTK
jgi:hypothetical protein